MAHMRCPASSVLRAAEKLMKTQRGNCIEYGQLHFSNHVAWVAVPNLRMGKGEEEVAQLMKQYNERIRPRSAGHNHGYASLLKFFDTKIQTDGVSQVCETYLPKITGGLGAAAFHPILELGLGVEGDLPTVVSNGLAYMYTRSWKGLEESYSVQKNGPHNGLVETLKQWEARRSECDISRAMERAKGLNMGLGGFQHRAYSILGGLKVFEECPVRVPSEDALHTALEEALLVTAAAICISENEFFLLHGFTSLWAVYHVVTKLRHLQYETKADLIAGWLRGYYATYIAQGAPVPLTCLLSSTPCALLTHIKTCCPSGDNSWEACFTVAETHQDEHVFKTVWMLHELSLQDTASEEFKKLALHVATGLGEKGLRYVPKKP